MPTKPLNGFSLIIATIALGLGTFIQILDVSITNVSLPSIAGSLGTSAENGTWIITSFAVSNGVVLLLTGWLAKRFGEVKLFAWSCALFSAASLLCGLSWNFPVLVFFRIVQGAVGGTLIPMSQSLILMCYSKEQKGLGLGLWAMIVVVAPILGPILGGWITDNWGWPWIFLINIPLGLISCILTLAVLKDRDEDRIKNNLDLFGFILVVLFVGSLQIMLDKGNDLDWFGSNFICSLVVISVISFIFWIIWEKHSPYPLVDLKIFYNRDFSIATLSASFAFFLFYGAFVLIPLWLQKWMGYTPYDAGLVLSGTGYISVILTPLVGKFLHLLDLRLWVTMSYLAFSFTFFWASNFTPDVPFSFIFDQRVMQGFATSLFFVPLAALALSTIESKELSGASGIFNFCRMIAGGGFGTSIFTTWWTRREALYHTRLTENINPFNFSTDALFQFLKDKAHFTDLEALQIIQNMTNQQTYLLSINDISWLAGWMFLLMILPLWFAKPSPQKNSQPIAIEG